jgi:hypothetical protein
LIDLGLCNIRGQRKSSQHNSCQCRDGSYSHV